MNISSKLPGTSTWWKAGAENVFMSLFSSSALGLDDVIGNFEVGKEFDALLINTKASDSPFDLFSADDFEVIIKGLMIKKINGNDVGKVHDTYRKHLLRVSLVTGIGCTTPLLPVLQPGCSIFVFLQNLADPSDEGHNTMSRNACNIFNACFISSR